MLREKSWNIVKNRGKTGSRLRGIWVDVWIRLLEKFGLECNVQIKNNSLRYNRNVLFCSLLCNIVSICYIRNFFFHDAKYVSGNFSCKLNTKPKKQFHLVWTSDLFFILLMNYLYGTMCCTNKSFFSNAIND